jgi:cellulose synthase/poly-beta-1,6-N-acetylglucosamine synthase-like glycosyltransferase
MLGQIILPLLLGLLAIPVGILFFQAVMAFPGLGITSAAKGRRPSLAILMPAHDEAAVIRTTIAGVTAQLMMGDRLLVVADNCSDTTASVAESAGAEIIERQDQAHRGKGYALDYGVRYLASAPPEVVIIIDADCGIKNGAIDYLARTALNTGRPIQARYLMHAPAGGRVMQRIAEFAWIVKNFVRPLGFYRLGLPCHLMGTGMAFPWQIISKAALANGHIVEDLKLGMDLAKLGTPPLFCPEAEVFSYFPISRKGVSSQRTRWEHGHISMILNNALNLVGTGIIKRNTALLALALDLCVPPVALLSLLLGTVFIISLLMFTWMEIWLPFAMASGMVIIFGSAIGLSWWRFGQHIIGLGDLLMTIGYVLWKVPLYLKFAVNKQVEWVRSERDAK